MRHAMSTLNLRRHTLAALAGLCFCLFGCAQQGAGPGSAALGTEPLPSPLATPYLGTPVAYLDEYPVTFKEVEDFARANLIEGSHHGTGENGAEVFKLLPGVVRQYAGVRYAVEREVHLDPWADQTVRIFRAAQMAGPMIEKIRQTALPTADQIRERLPGQWMQMDFELRVFGDLQQAQDAYGKISSGTPFARITGTQALRTRSTDPTMSRTGLLFPDSGFFDPADDGYLFTLKEGEVSRPIVTGLGPAIARVAVRKDFTDQEKAAHLAKITQEITDKAVQAATREAVKRSQIVILDDILADAVLREIEGQQYSDEVVAQVDDLAITYRQFRALKNVGTSWFAKTFPREKWASTMRGYLMQVIDAIAMGMEAGRQGLPESEGVKKGIHLYQWKLLFDLAQNEIAKNLAVTVGEDELLGEFHRDMAKYELRDEVTVRYYFTPEKGKVEALWKTFQGGKPFEELAADLAAGASPHGKSATQVRTKKVYRDKKTGLNALNDALFTMKEGETRLLEGPMGYYLVHVDSYVKGRQPAFAEVKDKVREVVSQRKKQAALAEELKSMEKKVSVRLLGMPKGDEQKGAPAPGTLDRG